MKTSIDRFFSCFFPLPPLMTLEGTWRFLTKKGPQFPSVKTMPPGDAFTCNARGWSGDHGLTNWDIYSMIIYVQPSRIHQYRGFQTVLGFKLRIICSEIKIWRQTESKNPPKSRANERSIHGMDKNAKPPIIQSLKNSFDHFPSIGIATN